MLMRSKTNVYQEGCTAGSLVKIFLFIKKEIIFEASCLQWWRLNSIERKEPAVLRFWAFPYTIYTTAYNPIDLAGKCN